MVIVSDCSPQTRARLDKVSLAWKWKGIVLNVSTLKFFSYYNFVIKLFYKKLIVLKERFIFFSVLSFSTLFVLQIEPRVSCM